MKNLAFVCCLLAVALEAVAGLPERERGDGLLVRVGAGAGFANQAGTGESAWYGPTQKGNCGFQYSVDVLNYCRSLGYGVTFRHYLHSRDIAGSVPDLLDEDVQVMYVAPQFSNIDKSLFFEGLTSNIDLGVGYAHYKSNGTVGRYAYDAPASGFGVNVNIGLAYQVNRHLSTRLSLSGEFYWFYNLHDGNDYSFESPFARRDKLKMVMIIPQLSVAYHF